MKIVCAVSGGLDSVTLLAQALNFGHTVIPVWFQYGSKHNPFERECFNKVMKHYHFFANDFKHIDLTELGTHLKSKLLLGGGDIPEGHYEEESMRQTVVPGRNIIFASILAGIAWSSEAEQVWLGVHSGDHFIYPDCRPQFVEAMRHAIEYGTNHEVQLEAPFTNITKVEIIKKGLELMVPYQHTRTCYSTKRIACGKCGSCQERLAGWKANGLEDPIDYETRELMPKKA